MPNQGPLLEPSANALCWQFVKELVLPEAAGELCEAELSRLGASDDSSAELLVGHGPQRVSGPTNVAPGGPVQHS